MSSLRTRDYVLPPYQYYKNMVEEKLTAHGMPKSVIAKETSRTEYLKKIGSSKLDDRELRCVSAQFFSDVIRFLQEYVKTLPKVPSCFTVRCSVKTPLPFVNILPLFDCKVWEGERGSTMWTGFQPTHFAAITTLDGERKEIEALKDPFGRGWAILIDTEKLPPTFPTCVLESIGLCSLPDTVTHSFVSPSATRSKCLMSLPFEILINGRHAVRPIFATMISGVSAR
jgi:hypothetical protein